MELSKKSVKILVASIVISLAGLIILQSYLLKYTIESKEQAFVRNVYSALNLIVHSLETGETTASVFRVGKAASSPTNPNQYRIEVTQFDDSIQFADELSYSFCYNDESTRLVQFVNDTLYYSVPCTQHVSLEVYNQETANRINLIDTIKPPGKYNIDLATNGDNTNNFIYRFKSDSANAVININGDKKNIVTQKLEGEKKHKFVTKIIDNLAILEWEPIENRIDFVVLDSIIKNHLNKNGINIDYVFGIVSTDDDSLRFEKPPGYAKELRKSEYNTTLFPNDLLTANNELKLYFPNHSTYIIKQISPLLFSTIFFMVIIVICFIYTIRTIISQKRFGRLLISFINNMTHEFKTPISSISLASEAIAKPEVISDKSKIERYNQMIKDENIRMRGQVDKILQMAILEKGDFELELAIIDIHEILRKAAKSFSIQIDNRNGKILTALNANKHFIKADNVHISNIFHNLIDNANKYSQDCPSISITTENSDNMITICIEDNGIGICDNDRKLVFDKYYRVPSGNIHSVKGFGLGLSYVKLMVNAHKGSISINSKLGKGTTVQLILPTVNDSH
jgi:two-component system phosphate regulon sensor histidine kinase PhoR